MVLGPGMSSVSGHEEGVVGGLGRKGQKVGSVGWKGKRALLAQSSQGARLPLLWSDKLFPALVHVFLTRTTCLWNN